MRLIAPLTLTLLLVACGKSEPLTPANAVLPDGGRYRGTVVDGLLQGPGRIDYPNGSWYAGMFKDGEWAGEGQWHGTQSQDYTGGFSHGAFEGQGTLKNGSNTYQGQFVAGQFTGQGAYINAKGDRYSGHFENGVLQGEGELRIANGTLYKGGFVDGQLDGQGRLENAEHNVWSGEFHKDQLTGEGEATFKDGSHYRGGFRRWMFSGEGELTLADGSQYRGHFERDSYSGIGTLITADKESLSGTWSNGERVRDADGKLLPNALENGLLAQGHLLEQALQALPASGPKPALYTLTVAGDGMQSVFMREAGYVNDMLAKRFGARGQVLLINHRDHLDDRPFATRQNIAIAVDTIAKLTSAKDLVFIYLTSHGSHDHQLTLDLPHMDISSLDARDFPDLLKPLAGRDKVIVISACFAGGFIPALKDQHTLVIAAAREDRVSFGCAEEADFTYFGDAFFQQALQQTDDLEKAFALASDIVAKREKEQHLEASEPQIWAPQPVLQHWRALRQAQAASPTTPADPTPATKL